ncbi:hypothetical protein GWO43_19965 [candidate division KSB1 bacterium]|nr:hypothetical protein [candidate division KSB1 bacterium]NIR71548.1 hypothetical protein [candidate division KSB1 bacterium]NIS26344.1 hypothetical protein [candidate division KSB1 bacterium]NIT73111.1 hypothetical protein [candidate division KSB1 bacterium]NIU27027.1 hypothetical protein [candidate division KSB1 bacterium]
MDNVKAVRDCAVRMLSRLGYEVACAEEGEQAVRLYEKAREAGNGYDLVIVDLCVHGRPTNHRQIT